MRIFYTITDSPIGKLLVAATERGLCAVKFVHSRAAGEAALRREYPSAEIARDDRRLRDGVTALKDYLEGRDFARALSLDLRATAFQRRVWEALRKIPYGETRSYREIAQAIGRPTAVRAVARACATNPIALLIPCHRVVRSDGGLGGYSSGIARKRKLLEHEQRRSPKSGKRA
ncbi:MAG: methylated-DNA--[protein]-cysteine S-methyltransferase [Candidatus Bipolaricaulota bacterium]|nr:methylated-DNA--[protein]-cysteine S-methyltransferase [Candidatus Bipolaricaulota bacterium]MDW8328922.1 methylated-DNA--[protein]-cysteine S-methyltransferase [Candidatus Bipolaricaulota bacterium]